MSITGILTSHPAVTETVERWQAIGRKLAESEINKANCAADDGSCARIRSKFSVEVWAKDDRFLYVFQCYINLDYDAAFQKMKGHLNGQDNPPPIDACPLVEKAFEYGKQYRAITLSSETSIESRNIDKWEDQIVKFRAEKEFGRQLSGNELKIKVHEARIAHWEKVGSRDALVVPIQNKLTKLKEEVRAEKLSQLKRRISSLSFIGGGVGGMALGALLGYKWANWDGFAPLTAVRAIDINPAQCRCIDPTEIANGMMYGGTSLSILSAYGTKQTSSLLCDRWLVQSENSTQN